jgi:hypothetical protein
MQRREFLAALAAAPASARGVEIRGDEFWLNGRPTYEGRRWKGNKIQGLLLNTRMVQATFDDENPATAAKWAYPDTGKWDPDRNTREFLAAMPEWKRHGVLGFTVNFQGGSPQGYSREQPWNNTAFRGDGTLKPAYLARMEKVLNRAETLGMIPIVGLFYFGQDERLAGDEAVRRAVREATEWILLKGWRNVMVEIANECDNRSYQQPLIQAPNIHELIRLCQSIQRGGRRLLVGASYNGGSIPRPNVVAASDFLLIHGNGVKEPERISEMVVRTRNVDGYRPMPILFNEDDHFDFDKPRCNFTAAIERYAGWGYFDPGETNYRDGYQCPPVQWGLNTDRKKQFFALAKEIAGV